MVVSVMRNADLGRLQEWADEYGVTHPLLEDTGGGTGDIGTRLSLDGHTPSNHLVGPGAVLLRREHRPTESELRELLGG